jgi:putative transposase
VIQRAFRYRLYPTPEQEKLLWQTVGTVRFVYNLALEQRRDWWRQAKAAGVTLNLKSQGRQITQLRAEVDWIEAVQATPLFYALRDLDRAFANFFAGRAAYPSPRRRGRNDSYRIKGIETRVDERCGHRHSLARVPKIGWVKCRYSRPTEGRIVAATISHDALGWHIAFTCEIEHSAPATALPAIGIDRGIANTLALSDGSMIATPDTSALERRRKAAQRVLARRQRGSKRYAKQRRRLASIAARIGRIRSQWQHVTSTDIARRFGAVAVEDLNVAAMTRSGPGKRGLNRRILEQGWGGFADKLNYKLIERGGALLKVNPAYTSQTCSACGVIDKASRESQSSFACRHCGFAGHADTNAAINILRRSAAGVEGADYSPVEARTSHALAA